METVATPTLEELKPGTRVVGTVERLTLYGALINIGLPQSALLHISQLQSTEFRNIEEVIKQGEMVEAYVLKVDYASNRVALTMVKPPELPWDNIRNGGVYQGKITRLEKFGAFVDIGAERPGMVHVSEMADGYVGSPSDVVKVGDDVEVRVIKLNRKKRQIDLSMKTPKEEYVAAVSDEPAEPIPTAMELALRRARVMSENRPENRARSMADEIRRGKSRDKSERDDIMTRTLRDLNK